MQAMRETQFPLKSQVILFFQTKRPARKFEAFNSRNVLVFLTVYFILRNGRKLILIKNMTERERNWSIHRLGLKVKKKTNRSIQNWFNVFFSFLTAGQ